MELHPETEDFKADIKLTVEEHHEVEIKVCWSGNWPGWDTIRNPARKKKLLGQGDRLIFWVLNNDCSQAVVVSGTNLKDEYITLFPTTRVPSGEEFFNIPIHQCNIINLKKKSQEQQTKEHLGRLGELHRKAGGNRR